MFPLRDNVPSRTFHFITYSIIAVNAWAFIQELRMGPQLDGFIAQFGLVPAFWRPSQLVTSMFLHGGWMHVVSNLWVLYIFGGSVEDRLGHLKYLYLYLISGILAGLTQLLTQAGSAVPTIGASGAIAGVMGAYFMMFPGARIATLVPIFIFLQVVDIPAFIYLGLWFFSQVLSGVFEGHRFGGVAWWAHIGGFLAGIYWVRRLMPGRPSRR